MRRRSAPPRAALHCPRPAGRGWHAPPRHLQLAGLFCAAARCSHHAIVHSLLLAVCMVRCVLPACIRRPGHRPCRLASHSTRSTRCFYFFTNQTTQTQGVPGFMPAERVPHDPDVPAHRRGCVLAFGLHSSTGAPPPLANRGGRLHKCAQARRAAQPPASRSAARQGCKHALPAVNLPAALSGMTAQGRRSLACAVAASPAASPRPRAPGLAHAAEERLPANPCPARSPGIHPQPHLVHPPPAAARQPPSCVLCLSGASCVVRRSLCSVQAPVAAAAVAGQLAAAAAGGQPWQLQLRAAATAGTATVKPDPASTMGERHQQQRSVWGGQLGQVLAANCQLLTGCVRCRNHAAANAFLPPQSGHAACSCCCSMASPPASSPSCLPGLALQPRFPHRLAAQPQLEARRSVHGSSPATAAADDARLRPHSSGSSHCSS